ncbi:iron ABC transporter substrate-binding protein [Solibacillus sp. R5-41]|uniref:ABC transporter substrate-binding protein n=1 Tax=Solibacillus sp. R5-41 TaxID=2048654 RepID=UPI000C1269E4|nr:iron-siderophore ABC transporter substrate-binding protein [Solibacillus sp. R5-41]ATP39741.1 iron ABC transporter substrate-binding protein [Solibacillus sp. R5-41]
MNKKLSFLLFSIIATIAILAACGNKEEKKVDSASAEKETTTSETRVIEHVLGKTEIKGTPKKIVTLYQGATDTLLEFGVKPIGVVESWAEQPIYEYLKSDLEGVTIVGLETQPNLEEIAALKPDLIIATQVRHEEIYEQLSQIAPTVVNTTLYDIKETTNLIGQAIGQEDQAEKLISDWESRVADFKEKIATNENYPLSVAVTNYRADHARIYVQGFAGSILTELGFKEPNNLQGQNLEIVKLNDKESISQMNADVIFQFMEDDAAVKNTYKEWSEHPLYLNLDAVKNEQVFTVNEIVWNLAGGLQAANLMLDELYTHFKLEK